MKNTNSRTRWKLFWAFLLLYPLFSCLYVVAQDVPYFDDLTIQDNSDGTQTITNWLEGVTHHVPAGNYPTETFSCVDHTGNAGYDLNERTGRY